MIVNSKDLKQALTAASKHAGKQGWVSLVAQGTELGVVGCDEWGTCLTYLLESATESEWQASIDSGLLLKALGKVSKWDQVLLEVTEDGLLLQQLNQADQNLPLLGLDPPDWDLRQADLRVRMPAWEWMWAIRSVAPFMSPDPTHHIIHGVLLEIGGEALGFTSTDTYRLTHHEVPNWECKSQWEGGPTRLVIPADTVNLCLAHQNGKEDHAYLYYDQEKHRVTVAVGPVLVTSGLTREGDIKFPNWRGLEDTLAPYTQSRTVNAEHLLVAARALAPIAERDGNRIRVTMADGNLTAEATGGAGEICRLVRERVVTGDNLQVAWGYHYLEEVAELFSKGSSYEDVVIESRDKDLCATKWTNPDYQGFHLLSPMLWEDPVRKGMK